jgi:hypothetical protein
VLESWRAEQPALQPLDSRPPYPLSGDEPRRVSRDAFFAWRSNRYSVPWPRAGRRVRHQTVRLNEHHDDIPLACAGPPGGKRRIHIAVGAPEVEVRSLAAHESAAPGGAL